MEGEIDKQMDKLTDEQMNKRTNGNSPMFYRTLSPSGPLPKNEHHHRKQVEVCLQPFLCTREIGFPFFLLGSLGTGASLWHSERNTCLN